MFEIYEAVKIKSSGKTGEIVAIDTDGGTKSPLYFVEICQKDKTGNLNEDMLWLEEKDLIVWK